MICFPHAKINLGLHIKYKRPDGYHELESVFYPIALKDALEIVPSPDKLLAIELTTSGLPLGGNEADNLCVKAYYQLKESHPELPHVLMHLHKQVPLGAGLGGGSADGAACLQLLNELFELELSKKQLLRQALVLGSDCPFFIIGKPALAQGRGELLKEIRLDLSDYDILIVHPGIHINTALAFQSFQPQPGRTYPNLEALISEPPAAWKGQLANDFEPGLFIKYPELQQLKELLYSNGAIYASMSGSGSSFYGIFEKKQRPALQFPSHYFYRWM